MLQAVNSREFKRWLAGQGCTFESKKSGSGHLIVRRGKRNPSYRRMAAGKNWVWD